MPCKSCGGSTSVIRIERPAIRSSKKILSAPVRRLGSRKLVAQAPVSMKANSIDKNRA